MASSHRTDRAGARSGGRVADVGAVESLAGDEQSILHLYRRVLAARRASAALRLGGLDLLDVNDGVIAYERTHGDDRRTVLVNFTSAPRSFDGRGMVEISSTGEGE